jgi:hypothetical protein
MQIISPLQPPNKRYSYQTYCKECEQTVLLEVVAKNENIAAVLVTQKAIKLGHKTKMFRQVKVVPTYDPQGF